jgi:holin, SPP1 family
LANPKNNKTAGIVRLVVLVLLLANQALVSFGYNPLPFSEEQIYEGVSSVALAISAIYAWWKHNNITEEAEEAQVVLERKKARK